MVKWFLYLENEVEGPFNTEEIHQRFESGTMPAQTLIWGGPQTEWIKLSAWKQQLPDLLQKAKPAREQKKWHFVFDDVSHGPMDTNEIIESLKNVDTKSEIFVWCTGMTNWIPLFECDELIEAVGMSRRQTPRVDIDGSVVVVIDGQEHIGTLKTIGAGGCGIFGIKGLAQGQLLNISLRAKVFYKPLSAKAEVRYATPEGIVGLKFESINMEEKSAIIDYVKDRMGRRVAA